MTIAHTPGLIFQKSGRSVGTQLTRVYLIQDGVDPETGDPIVVLSNTGPAEFVFTYDEPNNEILIDDDPEAPDFPVLNCVINADGFTVFYT